MESSYAGESEDFEQFLRTNRNKVDRSLNIILCVSVSVGPGIALGLLGGVFKNISYSVCIGISVAMLILSIIDRILLKKMPYSFVPGIFALVGMEILVCFMNDSHIYIRITWYMIPLLSLLFCNRWVLQEVSGVEDSA